MNPRTDYADADTATARAFIHLFIRHDDCFQFGRDAGTPEDEELRAHLSVTNHKQTDGQSTIGLTGINQQDGFATLADAVRTMGLTVVEETESVEHDDNIGEYTANTLTAYVEDNPDATWNKPCLLVYGSLSPEIEQACHAAFGDQFEYHHVRNHYVIVGDDLEPSHRTTLSDTVSRASYIVDDHKRDLVSDINTSTLV